MPPPVNFNGARNTFQRTSDSTHSDATDHGNLRSPNKNKNIQQPIGTQNTSGFDANSAAALLPKVNILSKNVEKKRILT